MKIEDVMTTDVATTYPDASLKEVAQRLVERKISGMPVISEDGKVLGVISEADLLVKERGATHRRRGPLAWLIDPVDSKELLKLEALVAGDAMTSPAITIEPQWSTSAAAGTMLERGINRLPVVRSGRLVGIVTRADLVRAFARSDEQIAGEIRDQVETLQAIVNDYGQVDVSIDNGKVTLSGRMERRTTAEALLSRVATVPGAVHVRSELTWVEDDSRPSRADRRESVF